MSGDKEQAFSGCLGILQNVKRPAIKAGLRQKRRHSSLLLLYAVSRKKGRFSRLSLSSFITFDMMHHSFWRANFCLRIQGSLASFTCHNWFPQLAPDSALSLPSSFWFARCRKLLNDPDAVSCAPSSLPCYKLVTDSVKELLMEDDSQVPGESESRCMICVIELGGRASRPSPASVLSCRHPDHSLLRAVECMS